MAKNILAFAFSGRHNGNSQILLNEILRPCKDQDFNIDVIYPNKMKLKPCIGCFGCNNGELKCIIKDDLEIIKDKIRKADAIILSSPCYILSAPSLIKNIMDRCAAWALDNIENGEKQKIGISISVAGATSEWFSLQKGYTSLFLKLFNCDVVYQHVFNGIAQKGDVLLYPQLLNEMQLAGKELAKHLNNENFLFPTISHYSENRICKHCKSDVFNFTEHGKLVCAVCGHALEKHGLFNRNNGHNGYEKFTPMGAKEHSAYIGQKIVGGMDAAEEVKRRYTAYTTQDILPTAEYRVESNTHQKIEMEWDVDALQEFERVVPKGFQKFVKQAVEKKAAQAGYPKISKDAFLAIKKESGN